MSSEKEIFKIDEAPKPKRGRPKKEKPEGEPKKKRVLSEKQLEALRKGREKREAKRLAKINKEGEKVMIKEQKEQAKDKKVQLKEQAIIKDKITKNEWESFKVDFIDKFKERINKCENPNVQKHLTKYMESYDMNKFKTIQDVKNKFSGDIIKLNDLMEKCKKKEAEQKKET